MVKQHLCVGSLIRNGTLYRHFTFLAIISFFREEAVAASDMGRHFCLYIMLQDTNEPWSDYSLWAIIPESGRHSSVQGSRYPRNISG